MNQEARGLLKRAETLMGQGDDASAIDAFRHLLQIEPDFADGWYNLGYLLRRCGDYPAALDAYAQAIACEVTAPEEVYLNRAVILSDHLHRHAEAEAELKAALSRVPDYPAALLNLGNLLEELGRGEEAAEQYDMIIQGQAASQDQRFEALARLARLRPAEDVNAPLLEALRTACDAPVAMKHETRANLHFALADSLDRLAAYDDAFTAYRVANRAAYLGARDYDPKQVEKEVDSIIAASTPAAWDSDWDAEAEIEPLFICGMFRSGSTLIEQVLAGHPSVTAGGELNLLPRLVSRHLQPFPESMASLDDERARALAEEYVAGIGDLSRGEGAVRPIVTDKRPLNYLFIGLIKRLFPNAKIIHTTRAPLDNCLSIYFQHIDPVVLPHGGRLEDIGHYYLQYRRLMKHFHSQYPGSIYDFPYEPFVEAPESTLAGLLEFLDLDWQDELLAFSDRQSAIKTASFWQARQPLYQHAVGRWQHYRQHLGPLMRALEGLRQA